MTDDEGYSIGLGIELHDAFQVWTTIGQLDVGLHLELRGGRYVCAHFEADPSVDHPDTDAGVTGEALREVPIGELVEECARASEVEETIKVTGRRIIDEAGGLTPESLEVVATAYRYGYAIGDSPTREVVNLLGLTRSKASRWIAEAREDGLLGATRERRAGGALLAVEAARDRVDRLEVQLAAAETAMRYRREEVETAERAASDPLRSPLTDLGIERRAEELRQGLEAQYDVLGRLQVELDAARASLDRLEAQED